MKGIYFYLIIFVCSSCTTFKKKDKKHTTNNYQSIDNLDPDLCVRDETNDKFINSYKAEFFTSQDRKERIIDKKGKFQPSPRTFVLDCYKSQAVDKKGFIHSKDQLVSNSIRTPMIAVNVKPVIVDYEGLRSDFAYLKNYNDDDIDNWLINNFGYISASQVFKLDFSKMKQVNKGIVEDNITDYFNAATGEYADIHSFSYQTNFLHYLSEEKHKGRDITDVKSYDLSLMKIAYRAFKYGRAIYIPAYTRENTQQEVGLFDVKGNGSLYPRTGWHNTGHMILEHAVKEFLMEKIIRVFFAEKPFDYHITPVYAVLWPEDITINGSSDAFFIVRRAINRKYYGENKRSSIMTDAGEVSMHLRKIGIKTGFEHLEHQNLQYWGANIQGGYENTIIDMSTFHFRNNEKQYSDVVGPDNEYLICMNTKNNNQERAQCMNDKRYSAPGDKDYIDRPLEYKSVQSLSEIFEKTSSYYIENFRHYRPVEKQKFTSYMNKIHEIIKKI